MSHKYKIDIWILVPVLLLIDSSIGAVYSASSDICIWKYQTAITSSSSTNKVISVINNIHICKDRLQNIWKFLQSAYLDNHNTTCVHIIQFERTDQGSEQMDKSRTVEFSAFRDARYTIVLYVSALLARKKDYIFYTGDICR